MTEIIEVRYRKSTPDAENAVVARVQLAFQRAGDFQRLRDSAGVVWSPLSNFLLYGETAQVVAAKVAGLKIALGSEHCFGWFEAFHKLVSAIPEVADFYRVAGNTDYLLKVAVSDIEGYDRLYKTLIKGADLADVTSMFVIEEIKHTTSFPLTHA